MNLNKFIFHFIIIYPLVGCATWESIGITSTKTHNNFVDEIQDFASDSVRNQGRIIEVTNDLNQESIYLAKKNDDMMMLERCLVTNGKIEHAKEVNKELSSIEFKKTPEPSFDWFTIISAISGMMTGGLTVGGGVAMIMRGRIKKIGEEAKKFALSKEVDDTSHLNKYGV